MRRVIALLAVFVLSLSIGLAVPGTALAADIAYVRVRLSTSGTSINITIKGNYKVRENGAKLTNGTTYTVERVSNSEARIKAGSTVIYSGSNVNVVEDGVTSTSNQISLRNSQHGTRSYLGDIRFRPMVNSGGTAVLEAINRIYLDKYVEGVIAHEMSNSWPLEALKAQAVAARSYVYVYMLTNEPNYDLGDTSSDQVYKGYNADYTRVQQAVRETSKQVLTHSGKVAQAYYAASNGGQTDVPGNVWGGGDAKNKQFPYFAVADDTFDYNSTSAEFETLVIPKDFNSAGSALKSFINYKVDGALPSEYERVSVSSITNVTCTGSPYPAPSKAYLKAKIDASVRVKVKATGVEQTITQSFEVNLDQELYKNPQKSEWKFFTKNLRIFASATAGNEFRIYHLRWGHGVGLSQRGAQARANSGHGYTDILGFYYPGATISTLSISESGVTVDIGGTQPNATIVQTNTPVSIYSSADTNSTVMGSFAKGDRIQIVEANQPAGWHKVRLNASNTYGYITAKYVYFDPVILPQNKNPGAGIQTGGIDIPPESAPSEAPEPAPDVPEPEQPADAQPVEAPGEPAETDVPSESMPAE